MADTYTLIVKDKLDKIFNEIAKIYPEKKIFCFDRLCPSQKQSLMNIAKEWGITYEQIIADYGYEVIKDEDAILFRNSIVWTPGNEPKYIEDRFYDAIKALNTYYPQKIIDTPIDRKHKRLFSVIYAFSLWLGYKTVFDFFAAYGYLYCVQEKNKSNKGAAITIEKKSNETKNNSNKETTILLNKKLREKEKTSEKTDFNKTTLKKVFSNQSKTIVESLKDFYESSGYLKNYEEHKWEKARAPEHSNYYYKITSKLIMCIEYGCSMSNYGTTPTAKLNEIIVAFRDGVTEYSLITEKLIELKDERRMAKELKKIDDQIEWLEYLNKNIKQIFPDFSRPFEFSKGEQLCVDSITIDKTKISSSNIASQYVVLDLETNGLRTANDDLLSISFFDPSNGKFYNRLLPLELQPTVLTTHINGIDDTDVENAIPLCQKEFNDLIAEFDLTNKTILYYSGRKFDFDFLDKYCRRHMISGMDLLKFENIKKRINSNAYATGNLTKDNLCNALGIEGVSEIHSGVNDCYLEWKLFEQFDCNRLLIINDHIYKYSDDYVVPASYLNKYPRLAEFANIEEPRLSYHPSLVYEFYLPANLTKKIRKFPTNISGISIENMINSMVGAKECDNREFLTSNKKKLQLVGVLPTEYNEILVTKNDDGTLKSLDSQYDEYIRSVNETSNVIRGGISEVIEFIKKKVFLSKEIRTQEITFSENNKVLAMCDLSSDDAILEMKTFDIFSSHKTDDVIRQIYYQKGNKQAYAMSIIFDFSFTKKMEKRLENLIFRIYKIEIKEDHQL